VENMVEDVRRLVQEAGLDEFRAERVKELLDSHGQQHCNADLKELAKELTQQREEEKEKDPPLKCTKTSDLQRILSATDTLTDELCDTDHDWERSAKVKRSKMVSIGLVLRFPKKERRNFGSQHCMLSQKRGRGVGEDPQPGSLSQKHNLCITPRPKTDQCRGLTAALTKSFRLGFKHVHVYVKGKAIPLQAWIGFQEG